MYLGHDHRDPVLYFFGTYTHYNLNTRTHMYYIQPSTELELNGARVVTTYTQRLWQSHRTASVNQTVTHIVETRPRIKFRRGIEKIHKAESESILWMKIIAFVIMDFANWLPFQQ